MCYIEQENLEIWKPEWTPVEGGPVIFFFSSTG